MSTVSAPRSARSYRFVIPVFFVLLVNAILSLLCIETLNRANLSEAIFWMMSHPIYARLNIGLLFFFSLSLLFFSSRLFLSVFLTDLILVLLGLIENFKVQLRNEAFVITDLLEAREALDAVGGYDLSLTKLQIIALVVMFILPFLLIGIRLPSWRLLPRLCGGFLTAAVFALVVIRSDTVYAHTPRVGAYRAYYANVGFPVGFIGSRPRRMARPEEYTQESVLAALNGVPSDPAVPETKPDIFFIMCETLFDPAKIPGLTIGEEVFPNLKSLMSEAYGGNLLVSQFGGGTAQTEYEVLTSYRAHDTSGGAYVTAGTLRDGMQSLPRLLREYGYYTEAMHPSGGGTYNRKNAYARLGFDQSVFRSAMSEVTELIGNIPADSWFFPEILRQYRARPQNQPYFSYIVTFQNHGGYIYRTVPHVIDVTGPEEPALTEAKNFVNGLALTDQAIGDFCEMLRSCDRPVVVVLFGDHCPSYSLFDSHPGSGPEAQFRSHTTPLLIWSNFSLDLSGVPKTITTYRLAAEIANLLGFKKDAYLNSLLSAEQLYYTGNLVLRENTLIPDAETWQREDERLKLLHYDRLLGSRWSLTAD